MSFLHGVEIIPISAGPRPIRTARMSVIGIVGTAPGAEGATAATLAIQNPADNADLLFTAASAGAAGNQITVELVDPGTSDAMLAVTVVDKAITITLGTDNSGVIDSTAGDVVTAVAGEADATALVTAANAAGSDGSGLVAPTRLPQVLTGGEDEPFPLNTPVLVVGNRTRAARLGTTGTLPTAMDGIFDQIGAAVVVVRVEEGVDDDATRANVVGGTNAGTGNLEGVHALAGAESVVGFAPRILCAPGWTHQRTTDTANAVVAELEGIAERLRAVIVADGPNTTDSDAIAYAADWGATGRVYVVDPWVKVSRNGETVQEPASARVAGVIARVDNDRGFWWSPSNQGIFGIVGMARPVSFSLGDTNSRANLLNERDVATIIRQDGFRLWGNRVPTADPAWQFISVRRIADALHESLQRAHLWAVDRNITKAYLEEVAEGVNGYIDTLKERGALLGGECWPDPDLNTAANIQQGKVFFNFDFTPTYPAEHITFRSHLVNTYIEEALT